MNHGKLKTAEIKGMPVINKLVQQELGNSQICLCMLKIALKEYCM